MQLLGITSLRNQLWSKIKQKMIIREIGAKRSSKYLKTPYERLLRVRKVRRNVLSLQHLLILCGAQAFDHMEQGIWDFILSTKYLGLSRFVMRTLALGKWLEDVISNKIDVLFHIINLHANRLCIEQDLLKLVKNKILKLQLPYRMEVFLLKRRVWLSNCVMDGFDRHVPN
ncbi:hypothetical protein M9H77_36334 [Catharanthus roseus]|uniref:Uncharacterized protein n=1 Tax=Catharanthus roseus TaxID=4058 RepID=A0ACB9ZRJ4_CATRO|nr:hypothetical protein M9H77_36334 [Catharanthus roseus]